MTQTASSRLGRGGELLQTDRRGEAGRPGPDDDDVVLHPLALDLRSVRPLHLCPPMLSVAADYRGSRKNPNSRDVAPP